ncbi:MAG TPA: class I SAM-dependent methyltransferase [Bryobacteraceae bacterium]|nr:class I SAM-dependent methyltransferase [Bryobacteraceae bacterium]
MYSNTTSISNHDYYTDRYSGLRCEKLLKHVANLTLEQAIRDITSWNVLFLDDFANRLAGKSVLELGSGDGVNALLMAKHGAKVTAIELAEPAARVLQEASDTLGLGIRALHGDFLSHDLPKFDFIIGKAFLHHLDHDLEDRFLSKCAQLLNVDGEARFAEPAVNSRLLDAIRWLTPVPGRPSILSRRRFKEWQAADPHPERDQSSAHYIEAGLRYFKSADVVVCGGIERFRRFIVNREMSKAYARWALEAERRYLPKSAHHLIARGQTIIYSCPLPSANNMTTRD